MSLVPQSRKGLILGQSRGEKEWSKTKKACSADQIEKKKEEFTLCCRLKESNSLKSQQRRVRLGVMSHITKVEHITGKDSNFSMHWSFQEYTGHTSQRSNTGLAGSAMRREFGERIFCLFDVSMTHWYYKTHWTYCILTNFSLL